MKMKKKLSTNVRCYIIDLLNGTGFTVLFFRFVDDGLHLFFDTVEQTWLMWFPSQLSNSCSC